MGEVVLIDKGQRSRSIAKRAQSIDKKLVERNDNTLQIAFTFYVIALAAKLARVNPESSSSTTAAELESFKEIFSIPDMEASKIEEFYVEALNDNVSATHYARQLVNIFPKNRLLIEELVDDLLVFADADSPMTSEKVRFLKGVTLSLRFGEVFFGKMLRKHMLVRHDDPYRLLDVNRNISYVDLKKKYRDKVKDWHPDKFPVQSTAPELAEIAREQFDIYNRAYEVVKKERGFSKENKK